MKYKITIIVDESSPEEALKRASILISLGRLDQVEFSVEEVKEYED